MADGLLRGWASTDDLDLVGHRVARGAFDRSIARRGLVGPSAVRLLLDHDPSRPAGRILVLETRRIGIGRVGLWIEAQLDLEIPYARDRWQAIKSAGGLNFSVGFWPLDLDLAEDADGDEYLLILRGDLFEVSSVTFPANPAAQMVFVEDDADSSSKSVAHGGADLSPSQISAVSRRIQSLKRELAR